MQNKLSCFTWKYGKRYTNYDADADDVENVCIIFFFTIINIAATTVTAIAANINASLLLALLLRHILPEQMIP